MTDLRDQLDAFEAVARRILSGGNRPTLVRAKPARCHPGRPVSARGLCHSCYQVAWRTGQLDAHSPERDYRRRDDFVADYQLLRSEGHTRRQIAERLRMTYDAVSAAYQRAVRSGALTPDRRAS